MRAKIGDSLRTLVTDAHARAGLGALRSLGRAGHTAVGGYPEGSKRPAGLSSRYCSGEICYPSPERRQYAFREWLCGQVDRGEFDAVLPVAEAALAGVAAVRKELAAGVLPIVPSDAALQYTLSKFHSTRMALSIGIPCPENARACCEQLVSSVEGLIKQVLRG